MAISNIVYLGLLLSAEIMVAPYQRSPVTVCNVSADCRCLAVASDGPCYCDVGSRTLYVSRRPCVPERHLCEPKCCPPDAILAGPMTEVCG
jgi:hypothetical protein